MGDPKTDPNLMLLYQCIQSTGGVKQIDFAKVGQALGIKDTAARMRYSRLVSRIKNGGGLINARVQISAPKKRFASNLKSSRPAIKKRKLREKSDGESVTSSGGLEEEFSDEEKFKLEVANSICPRRTRGIKLDFKRGFEDSSDDDGDQDSSWEEEELDGKATNRHAKISDAQKKEQVGPTRTEFRRSGSPPLSPHRIPMSSIVTPPNSTPLSINHRWTDQNLDFLSLTPGQMLVPDKVSTPATTAVATPGGLSALTVTEEEIMESIEHDVQEEQAGAMGQAETEGGSAKDADAVSEETDCHDDDDDEENVESLAHAVESVARDQPASLTLKTKSFFFWR